MPLSKQTKPNLVTSDTRFLSYLAKQEKLISIGVLVLIAAFLLLKFCFPYPDFFLDSYNYVRNAAQPEPVTYRPNGYPTFLTLTHSISDSGYFTVASQFLIYVFSSFFFFFSCDYLFGLPKKYKNWLFALVVFNPILLLQTNLVSSDSLFSSFTVIWFTLSLWCIVRPNLLVLVLQVIALAICFRLRYTALYFPIVAVLFFAISKANILFRFAGIALSLLIVYHFVEIQKDKMEENMGIRTLSGFTGWQIANNVLCYYKHVDVKAEDLPTNEMKTLDIFVKHYIDSVGTEEGSIHTDYLWSAKSPLKKYMIYSANKLADETSYLRSYFYHWCISSVLYSEYAWTIIKFDPMAYVRYFMLSNLKNFMYPELEILRNYDVLHSPLPPETKAWFNYDIDNLECRFKNLQKNIIAPFPAIFLLLNVFNFSAIAVFFFKNIKRYKSVDKDTRRLFIAWCVFYFSFALFCLFSTIVLLRYVNPLFTLGMLMPFVLFSQLKRQNSTSAN